MNTQPNTLIEDYAVYARKVDTATSGWNPFVATIDQMLEEAEAFYVALDKPDRTPDEELCLHHLLHYTMFYDRGGLAEHLEEGTDDYWTWTDRIDGYDDSRYEQLRQGLCAKHFLDHWEERERTNPNASDSTIYHFLHFSEAADGGLDEHGSAHCGGDPFVPMPFHGAAALRASLRARIDLDPELEPMYAQAERGYAT